LIADIVTLKKKKDKRGKHAASGYMGDLLTHPAMGKRRKAK